MRAETPSQPPACDLAELRVRAAESGAASLTTAECLALVLRHRARRGALGWAERLLATFGSLPELLGAAPHDLRRAAPSLALELELLHDLQRRALEAPLRIRPVLGSGGQVEAYLRLVLGAEAREQVRVLFLDARHRLIADEVTGRGTVDHAPVYPREILRRALELNASGLVLASNHPSGDATPRAAEVEVARRIVVAGRVLRLAVHDHLLVAGRQVVSFRALGLL